MRRPRGPTSGLVWALLALLGASHICADTVTIIANVTKGPQTSDAADLSAAVQDDLKAEQEDLQGMLHWALKHSDPEELKRQAEAAGSNADEAAKLAARQEEIREVMDYMKQQPTETDVIKAALETLTTEGTSPEDWLGALNLLQPMLEPVDNANDLKSLGGLAPLLAGLEKDRTAAVQAAAAHCIGTAASNNQVFQQDMLEHSPAVFTRLVEMAGSKPEATAVKAVYALGQLCRGNEKARALMLDGGGKDLLRHLVSKRQSSVQLRKKALGLVADLSVPNGPPVSLSDPAFFDGIIRCLSKEDWDLSEKALYALEGLLRVPRNVWSFKAQGLLKSLGELETGLRYSQREGDISPEYQEDLAHLVMSVKTAAMKPIQYSPGSDRTTKHDLRPKELAGHAGDEL